MPVIINKVNFSAPFSENAFINALAAVKSVPHPSICSDDSAVVPLSKSLFVFQREYAWINTTHPANSINYIGTKNIQECIFLLLNNGIDYLAVHVDPNNGLNLLEGMQYFKHKDNLEVTLIGGYENISSVNIFKEIFQQLLLVTEFYKIDVTITQQLILKDAAFTKAQKALFIFDKFLEKANYLSWYLLKKPLDFSRLSDNKPSDFATKEIVKTDEFHYFLGLLWVAKRIYSKEDIEKSQPALEFMTTYGLTEEKFYTLLKLMFSKQGFAYFDLNYTNHNIYPNSIYSNFVININTQTLYPIGKYFTTQHEQYRLARIYFMNLNKRLGFNSSYINIYDGEQRQIILPPIDNTILDLINTKIVSPLSTSIPTEQQLRDIEDFIGISGIAERNKIFDAIFSGALTYTPASTIKTTSFNFAKRTYEEYYNECATTSMSARLQRITNLNFFSSERKDTDFVVDAMCEFNDIKSAETAQKIVENDKGIQSYVYRFKGGRFFLTVPGINLHNTAQTIYNAESLDYSL